MLNFPDAPTVGQSFPPFTFDGTKWVRSSAFPSSALPLMNGLGASGDDADYTRGDHVHPIDTSRAPTISPAFSGGVTADAISVAGQTYIGGSARSTSGRVVSQMPGPAEQPSFAAHSIGDNSRGFFLDSNNMLAFGEMYGDGTPVSNVARFDNAGHLWLNGMATLGRDPAAPMEVATKQYVDARAAGGGGSYLPLGGGGLSGIFYPNYSPGSLTQGGGGGSFELQSGGGHDACLTLHRPGAFACNFGLASDHNFWYGGWSFGAAAYRLWSTRDFGGFPSSNERFAHAGDYLQGFYAGLVEPWGACLTASTGVSTFNTSITQRYRYWQLLTTGWWTVGFA